ncbi:MAG TPA: heavy metal-responsive transcriptional regulator [Terriglobales bacterium]|nr:heavy metal-responsive transcriptional regulator [Terriglobales bacterium]
MKQKSPANPSSGTLRSGALAKMIGVSPDTLRLYERKGLLSPPIRSANGYRCYSLQSVARVQMIRAAVSIGFTLDELAKILKIRNSGGAPCHKVRDLAAAKLRGLERQIEQMNELRDQLRAVLLEWDGLLGQTAENKTAGLLERLALTASSDSKSLPRHFYAALTRETRR